MSKKRWLVVLLILSFLVATVVIRKISPKWWEKIEDMPRDTLTSLIALFGARNEVVESIRETIVERLVADKLLKLRELSETESLQLHLYNQVVYDYKKYQEIKKVVQGESGWRKDVCGDSGTSCGPAQFKEKTFYAFAKEAGIDGKWENPYDQLTVMAWGWDNGKQTAWSVYNNLKAKGQI